MNSIKLNQKQILIVVAVILVLVIIITIFIYSAGKRKNPGKVKITKDIVGEGVSEEKKQSLTALAEQLYEDMDGLNVFGHKYALYSMVSLLSDSELAALSNIFNAKYELDEEESFYSYLDNEYFGSVSDFDVNAKVDIIKGRLIKIGAN